ncbi:MaoC family dehydratase N-terminal domain-containing protein [Chloroflexota bacterium]
MAVRGEYNKAEEKMLADTAAKMETLVGWAKSPMPMVASGEAMKTFGFSNDKWNPMWYDEKYAANTRWGSIVAIPTSVAFGGGAIGEMPAPEECGWQHMVWIGEDWELFQPVRPGDAFRVWQNVGSVIDKTPADGKSPRTFELIEGDLTHINQKNQIVCTTKNYVERVFMPDGPPKPYTMPEYGYKKEELEYINSIVGQEEVRGANIRYWEDVSVGDETKPVVTGPTNMSTNCIINLGIWGMGEPLPPRVIFNDAPGNTFSNKFLKDPETGLYYERGGPAGRHWNDREARFQGEPGAFLFAVVSKYTLLRVLTNWMGDDGFLRRYNWRHIMRTIVGDTIIGHGKVTGKRAENGEHLVDLIVWLENMRGNTSEAAAATVRLPSREKPISEFK